MKESLPGVGSDVISKQGLVFAPLQPVNSTVLPIRPTGGQIGGAGKLVVHNGAIPQRRPQDLVAPLDEHVEQSFELVTLHDRLVVTRDGCFRHGYPPLPMAPFRSSSHHILSLTSRRHKLSPLSSSTFGRLRENRNGALFKTLTPAIG